ncbi:hypothetical protein Tco_0903611 [Tanacetum coccineum]
MAWRCRACDGFYTASAVRECTFAGFMKCNPAVFRGIEGAVESRRWFKKTESVFEIIECTKGKKVKFATATLEGPALTWWKTKVATSVLIGSRRTKAQRAYRALRRGADQGAGFMNISLIKVK